MSLRSSIRQLKRNTRTWRRTAMIGALLVLGTCLWTPSLVSTVFGTSTADSAFVDARSQSPPPPIEVEASFGNTREAGDPTPEEFKPYNESRTAASDPLSRSVEVGGIRSHSFRTASVEWLPSLNISMVSNRRHTVPSTMPSASTPNSISGLRLHSTIIGVQRKAAMINHRLYFEGAEIQVGDHVYRLSAVHPRKVVLRRGASSVELRIAADVSANDVSSGEDTRSGTHSRSIIR